MNKTEYLEKAFELLNTGKISNEAYDRMILNVSEFIDENE